MKNIITTIVVFSTYLSSFAHSSNKTKDVVQIKCAVPKNKIQSNLEPLKTSPNVTNHVNNNHAQQKVRIQFAIPKINKAVENKPQHKPSTQDNTTMAPAEPVIHGAIKKITPSHPDRKISVESSVSRLNHQLSLQQDMASRLANTKDTDTNDQLYYGHIDYTGKVGTTRAIQRIDLFQPFFRTDDQLFFMDIRAGNDSHKNLEYNLGLGFRNMAYETFINGFYSYFDSKRSPSKNVFYQITTGYELMFSNFEARFNAYIPVGRRRYTLKETTYLANNYFPLENQTVYQRINNVIYEKGFGGFDIEFGGSLPFVTPLNIYATYYRFMANGMDTIEGVRLRGGIDFNQYFALEGSVDLGAKNQYAKYIGIRLTLPFGQPANTPSTLERKMVSLPTRDIDILSDKKQEDFVTEIKKILGKLVLLLKKNAKEEVIGNAAAKLSNDRKVNKAIIKNILNRLAAIENGVNSTSNENVSPSFFIHDKDGQKTVIRSELNNSSNSINTVETLNHESTISSSNSNDNSNSIIAELKKLLEQLASENKSLKQQLSGYESNISSQSLTNSHENSSEAGSERTSTTTDNNNTLSSPEIPSSDSASQGEASDISSTENSENTSNSEVSNSTDQTESPSTTGDTKVLASTESTTISSKDNQILGPQDDKGGIGDVLDEDNFMGDLFNVEHQQKMEEAKERQHRLKEAKQSMPKFPEQRVEGVLRKWTPEYLECIKKHQAWVDKHQNVIPKELQQPPPYKYNLFFNDNYKLWCESAIQWKNQ